MFNHDWNHKRESLIKWLEESELGGIEKILDVGCGYGHLSEMLRTQYPEAEVFGLDRDIEGLFNALCKKRLEKGCAIHGNALNLPHPEYPIAKPEHFYSVMVKEGETGEYYGVQDVWNRIERTEMKIPRDFDLVVCHDAVPYDYPDDWIQSMIQSVFTPQTIEVPVSAIVPAAKKKGRIFSKKRGYVLYSLPTFTLSTFFKTHDFSYETAANFAKLMSKEVKDSGLKYLECKIVGDVEIYRKDPSSELNIGVLCRRK